MYLHIIEIPTLSFFTDAQFCRTSWETTSIRQTPTWTKRLEGTLSSLPISTRGLPSTSPNRHSVKTRAPPTTRYHPSFNHRRHRRRRVSIASHSTARTETTDRARTSIRDPEMVSEEIGTSVRTMADRSSGFDRATPWLDASCRSIPQMWGTPGETRIGWIRRLSPTTKNCYTYH